MSDLNVKAERDRLQAMRDNPQDDVERGFKADVLDGGSEPREWGDSTITTTHYVWRVYKMGFEAARRAVPAQASAPDDGRVRALHAAVAAIYFDDGSDFRSALGAVVRHLDADLAGELLGHPKAAYDKACAMLESAAAPAPLQGEQSAPGDIDTPRFRELALAWARAVERGGDDDAAWDSMVAHLAAPAPGGEPSARVAVGPLAVQRIPLKQPMDGASLARDGTGRDWVLLQGTAQIRYLDQYERNFVHSAIDAALSVAAAHAPAPQENDHAD